MEVREEEDHESQAERRQKHHADAAKNEQSHVYPCLVSAPTEAVMSGLLFRALRWMGCRAGTGGRTGAAMRRPGKAWPDQAAMAESNAR